MAPKEISQAIISKSEIPLELECPFFERLIEILIVDDEQCVLDLYSEYLNLGFVQKGGTIKCLVLDCNNFYTTFSLLIFILLLSFFSCDRAMLRSPLNYYFVDKVTLNILLIIVSQEIQISFNKISPEWFFFLEKMLFRFVTYFYHACGYPRHMVNRTQQSPILTL
jgi:hypothetical protein